MSTQVIGFIAMGGLFVLIMLRVPVAIALGVTGFLGYAAIDDWRRALIALANTPYDLTDKYAFTVVPMFILMGVVASKSGMSGELYRAANAIFAGARGALAMATIGACAAFGSICGSSLATAATMSRAAIPEMRKFGYDERLSSGVVASAGCIGAIIPPSLPLIIYAIIAEQGVPQLFAAALIPGIIISIFHVIVVMIIARVDPQQAPLGPSMPMGERVRAILAVWKVVLLFSIAVVGIYTGFMSPTEAAAVAAFVAILIAFGTRSMGWRGLIDALLETVWTTGQLFFIVIGAFLFAYFIVLTQLPNSIQVAMKAIGAGPYIVMLLIVVFYLILGCFLDAISMILITIPIFLPVSVAAGWDPIWFGILVLIAVEVGLITPPVGLNIFVVRATIPDIALGDIYRGIVPFLWAHLATIAMLILFPVTALWLPKALYN
jgi:C4-dicarboxylate transporter, DctM subunit